MRARGKSSSFNNEIVRTYVARTAWEIRRIHPILAQKKGREATSHPAD